MKKQILSIVLACAGTLVLAGCATERVMTTGTAAAPTNPTSVQIFLTEKPTVAYEELGRVSVDKYNNFAMTRSPDELNNKLKEKAASIGGDAIIGVTEDFASISGVVVKYKK